MARIDTALQRLLNQFSDSVRLKELLEVIFNRVAEVDSLLEDLLLSRWIDTAEGVWLDVVGDVVGVERPFAEVDPSIIFTYKSISDPNDPNKGYGTLPQTNLVGLYSAINGLLLDTPASDEDYRKRIKAKAATTGTNVAYPDIYTFVTNTFAITCQLSSPYVGRVEIEINDYLNNQDRRFLIEYAPVSAGIEVEIMNWPSP